MFLKISQISQENMCWSLFLIKFKKETSTQVFSCEICEIYKNTYFEEHLRTIASDTPLSLKASLKELINAKINVCGFSKGSSCKWKQRFFSEKNSEFNATANIFSI